MGKAYKWLYTRVGGRPWTDIMRDSYHGAPLLWLLGATVVGTILGHLFW